MATRAFPSRPVMNPAPGRHEKTNRMSPAARPGEWLSASTENRSKLNTVRPRRSVPTPCTSRYARRPADTAAACSPSAPRVTAAMPTVRRRASGRSSPLGTGCPRATSAEFPGPSRPSRLAECLPQPSPAGWINLLPHHGDRPDSPSLSLRFRRPDPRAAWSAGGRAGGSSRCGSHASTGQRRTIITPA